MHISISLAVRPLISAPAFKISTAYISLMSM